MIGREQRFGFLNWDTAKLIGGGQVFQTAEAEVLQELRCGAVSVWAARHFGAAGLLDEATFEQRLHNAVDRHAANLLDLGARERLAIRDDRQRFKGGLRQTRRANLVADQRFNPWRVIWPRRELP